MIPGNKNTDKELIDSDPEKYHTSEYIFFLQFGDGVNSSKQGFVQYKNPVEFGY